MSILENLRAMGPELAAEDAEGASARRLTPRTWELLQASGITRALQPARWGGAELSLAEYSQSIMEIARHSPSAGWVAAVLGIHPWQLGQFDERAQDEMWEKDPARIHSSSYTPTGSLTRVEGGFRLSGRWSFSSGSELCDAVVLGGVAGPVEVNGRTIPDVYSAILYDGEYRIEQTWNTAGLQGTGSHDIVVDDVFVPEYRTQSHTLYSALYGAPLPGQAKNEAALFKLPWSVVFTTILASASVGASRGFLDTLVAELANKPGKFGNALKDNPMMQHRVAEGTFTIEGAQLRIVDAAARLQAQVAAGDLPDEDARAHYRWTLARSAQDAGRAVTEMYRMAGGRVAFTDAPLHRKFQDVTTGLNHAFLFADPIGTTFGAKLLGSQNNPEVPL